MEKDKHELIADIAQTLTDDDCVVLMGSAKCIQSGRGDLREYLVSLAIDALLQCVDILEDYPFAETRKNLDFNNVLNLTDCTNDFLGAYEAALAASKEKNATGITL